jgi:hypothetical protein
LIDDAQPDFSGGFTALLARDGTRIAVTPTCAANVLGMVPDDAFAHGDAAAARRACEIAGAALGLDADTLAHAILDRATERLRVTLDELIADYALERTNVVLVGGGGGAAAIVPYAAQRLGFVYRIARNAQVISPLGVALALVRDVVERTMLDPTPDDLARIRREAIDAAVASGAAPDRVEVVIEVDTARNRVRATASGATALVEGAQHAVIADEAAQLTAAATHLGVRAEDARVVARTNGLAVIASAKESAVVDARGVVRLVLPGAFAYTTRVADVERSLARAVDDHTAFGDVGRALPDVFLLRAGRIGEFAGMAEAVQIAGLVRDELAGVEDAEEIVLVIVPKRA